MRCLSKLSLYEVKIGQEDLLKNVVIVAFCKVDHFYVILWPLLPLFHV
jgi:hypothetical protein